MAYWDQRITVRALNDLRSLSDKQLNWANLLVDILQADPRASGHQEEEDGLSISMQGVTVKYEIVEKDEYRKYVRILEVTAITE